MAGSPRPVDAATPVQYLKGVGPIRAQQLRRLSIESVGDLLHHYPSDYVHRGTLRDLGEVRADERVVTRGRVLDIQTRRTRRGRGMIVAVIGEGNARLRLTWFNAPYMAERLRVGREILVAGEVTQWGGRVQIVNPATEDADADSDLGSDTPQPRYPLTAGLRQHSLRRLVQTAVELLVDKVEDPLSPTMREAMGLVSRADALRRLHTPSSIEDVDAGRERIAFEEAFALQLAVGHRRDRLLRRAARIRLVDHDGRSKSYVESLGFALTGAQRRVLSSIAKDLRAETAMHRLLQGDVGSGKTVVGVIAMLFAVEAGGQAAFMAPTEVLARQHGRRQIPLLDAIGVRGEVLTGSTRASERRRILAGLADGSVDVIFGTHALIQDDVRFDRLALAIIDEQHRFGVMQRATLAQGGSHVLVMSATPIPRSLALTVYGDLDLSVLDELPPGRTPVRTEVQREGQADSEILAEVRTRAERGEQTFLVYPLVEESEEQDLESAESAFAKLGAGPLEGIAVGLLHGRMKPAEKEEVAQAFGEGRLQVLVATTVIEVGVDVPEASLMVIHHAERFGLAQLHQLRGRVGRGRAESRCILIYTKDAGGPSVERLRKLASTTDGFRVAEFDLEERGMGNLHGTQQHGELPFRLLSPLRDALLVERARELARDILTRDASLSAPEHGGLRRWLDEMGRRSPVWSIAG